MYVRIYILARNKLNIRAGECMELALFTLGIRVPETDRFGSSGIRVPRNWNRSVPSSISGNSVSGSGNSVRFRVFPNGTKKMKKNKKTTHSNVISTAFRLIFMHITGRI
jgi:hypothetical protein